jgi:CHAD domain-containing protein
MPAREVTLAPPPGFRLPSLAQVVDGVTAEPDELLEIHATYFDTADLRLTRAGARLCRHEDAWSVELPPVDPHDREPREEHRFTEPAGAPPVAALDLVWAYTRAAPVAPVARLKTRRRRIRLANGSHTRVGEVVDDEVTVLDGTRITARFRELDVTLAADAPASLADAVVARLRAAGAGPAPAASPLARALGPHALTPPDVAPPPPLPPDASVATAVTAALAHSVARLVAHDAGTRLGEDPEYVHQARVATRRLRSDLRTFRTLLEPSWDRARRDELRWLGQLLGAVRDADVLRGLLREQVERLDRGARPIGAELLDSLAAQRHARRIVLLDGMRTARYSRLLDSLVDAAHHPALRPDAGGLAADRLPPLVRGPWHHLERAVHALPDDPPDPALHDIRKRAKRLRYAAEAVAPVARGRVASVGRRAAALQDVLGRHQDSVVASTWLQEMSRNASTRPEAFVAGELAGLFRAEELATRAAWPKQWRRLAKQARRALR